jgi:hypothetical protein
MPFVCSFLTDLRNEPPNFNSHLKISLTAMIRQSFSSYSFSWIYFDLCQLYNTFDNAFTLQRSKLHAMIKTETSKSADSNFIF